MSQKLGVTEDVAKLFPDLRIGIVIARGVNNLGYSEEIEALKQIQVEAVRRDLSSETLSQHPYIAAWRETYRRFGTKAKEHKPTAEALLRRILRGENIPTISKIVDLYLAMEAEFYLPIGGYDLDNVTEDIALRLSSGGERFVPIGMSQEEMTYSGEVVYSDHCKVLTRRWNYRDCDAAKITPESKNIALFCEAALPDIPTTQVINCVQKLADYIQKFCAGSVVVHMLDVQQHLEQNLTP
jgi:DNA/RNA-binding domain of Phe-tRNA-synthetase-like protein